MVRDRSSQDSTRAAITGAVQSMAISLLTCLLVGTGAPALHAQSPTVIGLSRIINDPTTYSAATAINDQGVIGGELGITGMPTVFFVLDQNGITNIRALTPGRSPDISAINSQGTVGGTLYGSTKNSAFRFAGGAISEVSSPGPGFNRITDLNDSGVLVGEASLPRSSDPRFSYSAAVAVIGNTVTPLGSFSPATEELFATAQGINNAGIIVGEAADIEPGASFTLVRAFRFADGVMTNLHQTLGGTINNNSRAFDINNLGTIVGIIGSDGFVLDGDNVTRITAPSTSFDPRKVNDRDLVIGRYSGPDTNFEDQPFLFREGVVFDLNTLVQPFLAAGDGPGFTRLSSVADINNRNQIVGTGLFRDAGGSLTQQAFLLNLAYASTFVWEGAEGFSFRNDANWSEGVAPGAIDTVQLTAAGQLKTIEFTAGDFVTNQRLVANGGSETEVDLNGGLWRIDPAGSTEAAVEFSGASLSLKDGTLEVFGNAELGSGGLTGNLLEVSEGGKFILRNDGILFAGDEAGNQTSSLLVQGDNSLMEAGTFFLGFSGGGEVTAQVTAGGTLRAGVSLQVGGSAPAEVVISGAGSTGPSKLDVAANGTLLVGSGAGPGLVRLENGAVADLIGTRVSVGEGAEAEFVIDGSTTRVDGGNFTIHQHGILAVSEGEAAVEKLTVAGGQVFVRNGALLEGLGAAENQSAALEIQGGRFTIETGATFVTSRIAVGDGQINVTGGGLLRVTGTTITDAVIGAGTPDDSLGLADLEVKGSNANRASTLSTEGPLVVGLLGAANVRVLEGAAATLGGDLRIVSTSNDQASAVLVSGTNSTLTTPGVSLTGPGATLLVEDGASLSVTPSESGPGITTINAETSVLVGGVASFGIVNQAGGSLSVIAPDARVLATSMVVDGGVVAVNSGTLETPQLTLNGGVLLGRGRILGNVTQNGGQILPGQSPGTLTIEGDFSQTGGRIVLEIGGLNPGSEHDQFVVSGDFLLSGAGTIEFAFVGGFAPAAGQTFSFFDVGGTFTSNAQFAVSGLEEGWQFETAFDPETGSFGLLSLNAGVAIPEPGVLGLLGVAVFALFVAMARPARDRVG